MRLNLAGKGLTELPYIDNDTTILDLSHNNFTHIDLSKLPKKINKLYLHENKLVDIDLCKSLENLEILSLWNNELTSIDFEKLPPNIWKLNISYNNLVNIDLTKLTEKIEVLYLCHNELEDIDISNLPNNLRKLDLSDNKLSFLSEDIVKYNNLEYFSYDGNPIKYISPNIRKKFRSILY